MFWIQVSNKEKQRNSYKWENQFLHLKSLKTLEIPISVLTVLASIMTIILLASTEESYAQESDNTIKLSEYTNSKAAYKISYPSGAEINEQEMPDRGIYNIVFEDKDTNWRFVIKVHSNYKGTLEEIARGSMEQQKRWGENTDPVFQSKVTGIKPLKVAGQPALMFDEISQSLRYKHSYIYLIANNLLYSMEANADIDKYDEYAGLFFTMIKSFELIDQKSDN